MFLSADMPDVVSQDAPAVQGTLDWVGMSRVELPLNLVDGEGVPFRLPAKVDALVNVADPHAKGIHMSRLMDVLNQSLAGASLSHETLANTLKGFLHSHPKMSQRARLHLYFDYPLLQRALVSDNAAWRFYPVTIDATLTEGRVQVTLGLQITYSSTCPCSAALARQLIQKRFLNVFGERDGVSVDEVTAWLGTESGICATPHAQRSEATVSLTLQEFIKNLPIADFILALEAGVTTPVQAFVKREDEQAFAELNGENLMFCEDAARRLKAVLQQDKRVQRFSIEARHLESLHPHDAVARVG